jgi:hypothetical protein
MRAMTSGLEKADEQVGACSRSIVAAQGGGTVGQARGGTGGGTDVADG